MKLRCLACSYEFSAGEAMKSMYTGKSIFKAMLGRPRPIFCPRCDVEGPRNFVCSECGQYHMWSPGPCKRVNR